jgi:hypothetical protein
MTTSTRKVRGTMVNSRTGQKMEEGKFLVRELTLEERRRLPQQVRNHEGETAFGSQRICMSVESEKCYGGFLVLVWG